MQNIEIDINRDGQGIVKIGGAEVQDMVRKVEYIADPDEGNVGLKLTVAKLPVKIEGEAAVLLKLETAGQEEVDLTQFVLRVKRAYLSTFDQLDKTDDEFEEAALAWAQNAMLGRKV